MKYDLKVTEVHYNPKRLKELIKEKAIFIEECEEILAELLYMSVSEKEHTRLYIDFKPSKEQ